MSLINFRKLLFGKTKKTKPTTSRKTKRSKPTTSRKTKKTKSSSSRKTKRPTSRKKNQKGAGGNYHLDVTANTKIGGLPIVSPINDCPKGVSPTSPDFGTAIYTSPIVGGGRRKKSTRSKRTLKKPRTKSNKKSKK